MTTQRPVGRNAEASRAAILAAAETTFAEVGYEAASLGLIAERAGVSRGTPGYFFGAKEQLYQAVLERRFAETSAAIEAVRAQLPARASSEQLIDAAVDSYLDFLIARPAFVKLMSWEALAGGKQVSRLSAHLGSLREGLAAFRGASDAPPDPAAPLRLLITLIALCWFPIAHNLTLLEPLGVSIDEPAFLAGWKTHVKQQLRAALETPGSKGVVQP